MSTIDDWPLCPLRGTLRQIAAAGYIRAKVLQALREDGVVHREVLTALATIDTAATWLDHQQDSLCGWWERGMLLSRDLQRREQDAAYSPFADHFPRYGHADAVRWARGVLACGQGVLLDTETTGIKRDCEIVDIALVRIDQSAHSPILSTLVRPADGSEGIVRYARLAAEHPDVFGIPVDALDDLASAPTFADIWPLLLPVLQQRRLIVYNARFDVPMVLRSARRMGLLPSGFRVTAECAMKAFAAYSGLDDWLSLDDACAALDIDPDAYGPRHRALPDACLAAEVVRRMAETG
jgi:DNA polymerase III epsilon subunit-like protein